jgi:crossover junction endodeoxyribonuclease RuvC
MRVLGIDPGSRVTGFGVVEAGGPAVRALAWGVIRLGQKALERRLLKIFQEVSDLLAKYRPEAVVLEEVVPETYPRAALKLGQAQGVAILAAASSGLPVYLYHPLKVKQALTGYGNASKEQVAFMVKRILGIEEKLPLDASDALSVGIYHLQTFKQREALCSPR